MIILDDRFQNSKSGGNAELTRATEVIKAAGSVARCSTAHNRLLMFIYILGQTRSSSLLHPLSVPSKSSKLTKSSRLKSRRRFRAIPATLLFSWIRL